MSRRVRGRPAASDSSSHQQPPPYSPPKPKPLHVAFLHLDLGIGGAEQLLVNAAVALQQRGHTVTLYTSHHDPTHCFAETRGRGALAPHVHVAGDWLPRQIFGRFTALCAVVRMLYLALVVGFSMPHKPIDVVFCDGVSAMIPLLRFLWGFPVLFYCHFPDKLLCTDRASFFKRCYRAPLDWVEEATTGAATVIAVNSHFTSGVFAAAFPWIAPFHADRAVIYPAINLDSFVPPKPPADAEGGGKKTKKTAAATPLVSLPFVSLNRFERKKNIGLALEALALVRHALHHDPATQQQLRLIIAGGYDASVLENKEYMRELQAQAKDLGLTPFVSFRPSISDAERAALLQDALAVLYTPDREHFGIVPLEAMYAGSPVVAVASGGPLETVQEGVTGFLCPGDGPGFAAAMLRFVRGPGLKGTMGQAGHAHVKAKFGLGAFATTLEAAVVETLRRGGGGRGWLVVLVMLVLVVGLVAVLSCVYK